jgi:hypothetical protein
MATPLSVSIVHPGYTNLKRFSPLLHLLAGLVFITGARYEFMNDNRITAFCEFVIGADVIVIAFMRRFAEESSHLNAWFRLIEVVVLSGIGVLATLEHAYLPAAFLFAAACIYGYIFHCERKLISKEKVQVHHLGFTISSFPKDKELEWEQIQSVQALPHSITITTFKGKIYRFDFQKPIAFSELAQIHEFCSHYLDGEQAVR